MARKNFALLVRDKRVEGKVKHIPDTKIDFSDIPELTDEQLSAMKRLGRPLIGLAKRQLISIRIDPQVLNQIKKRAKKRGQRYQNLINEILANFVGKKVA